MSDLVPDKLWWTANEIAAAKLPDLPTTQQNVEALAKRQNWRETRLARPRSGRGGGWEYSWELFPMHAKRALLKDKAAVLVPKSKRTNAAQMDRAEVWEWFDRQRDGVKQEARDRLVLVQKIDALTVHCPKGVAVATLAREHDISEKTIWNYLAAISGKPRHDWLPYLAPRHSAAPMRRNKVTVDPEFMARFKSDFLRPAGPSLSAAYRRTAVWFREHGQSQSVPPEWLTRRRYRASTSTFVETLMRDG